MNFYLTASRCVLPGNESADIGGRHLFRPIDVRHQWTKDTIDNVESARHLQCVTYD